MEAEAAGKMLSRPRSRDQVWEALGLVYIAHALSAPPIAASVRSPGVRRFPSPSMGIARHASRKWQARRSRPPLAISMRRSSWACSALLRSSRRRSNRKR